MQLGHVLVEVAKRGNRPWAELYLVKEKECLARFYLLAHDALNLADYPPDVEVVIKDAVKPPVLLEVQFDERRELLGEVPDGRCLARLSRTAQQHWLAERIILPFKQGRIYVS